MAQLRRFRHWTGVLCMTVGGVGAVALVLMTLLTTLDVIGRDTMNRSILGVTEMVEFVMLVAVCSSFGVTQIRGSHIMIDVLVSRMPPRFSATLAVLTWLLTLTFIGLIAWAGYGQAMMMMARKATSSVLVIPYWPFYLWLCFGWGILFLACLADLLLALGNALGRDDEPQEAPRVPLL